jgi:hypothetical protein
MLLIDSLKQEIYRDTIKFDKKDLSVCLRSGTTININSYSMLYVINGAYFYALDIIPPNKVVEFVDEFLDIDKVKSIGVVTKETVQKAMFDGSHVQNGIVLIELKRKTKFNPLVAGLEKIGKQGGDNYRNKEK